MLQIELRDINNNAKGTIGLQESVFGSVASEAVVHSAVVNYLANQRQGTHATKTRAMVSGGGKKPWKQKHTGRARHGSSRSPIWRGGGTTFGPQPRDYYSKLPKNIKKTALYKALTMKFEDNEVVVLDSLSVKTPKTKEMVQVLKNLGLSEKTVLFVLQDRDDNIACSVGNIPTADVIMVSDLNAYSVAVYDHLVFTVDAVKRLQAGEEVGNS